MKHLRKLAVVCGGTGGHFYPGLSVARALRDHGGDATLILSGQHVQAQSKIASEFGLESIIVPAAQRPKNIFKSAAFLHTLCAGFLQARKHLRNFQPDAILAMGSFASAPGAFAAIQTKTPLFLHDGNARIGRANLFFSRWAKHLATAFPAVNDGECRCACSCLGMPIRAELLEKPPSRPEALSITNERYQTNFTEALPVILVFAGSQGAASFQSEIPRILSEQNATDFQVIHLTGSGYLNLIEKNYEGANFQRLVIEKSDDMASLYALADMVICRSGGSTVAELAHFAKFSALVPFPYAADLHQNDNADFYSQSGAAKVIPDKELAGNTLLELIRQFRTDPKTFREKGMLGKSQDKPDATKDLLELIDFTIANQ